MITFILKGKPIPQHRPRACRRGKHIHMYSDQEVIMEQYKNQIRSDFQQKPFSVPVEVSATFFFPIPKGTSKVRTTEMQANILKPMKRPDLDNLLKFILDCMNGIVYEDDSQVVSFGKVQKRYGDEGISVIHIEPLLHTRLVKDESDS